MLQNFIKIAVRNIFRNKVFSIVNILGLGVGMASSMLILLWIVQEVSYDQFHTKKERIYKAWNRSKVDGKILSWDNTPKVLATVLQKDIPQIEQVSRASRLNNLITNGDKRLTANGIIVDSSFLDIFDFPLVEGNIKTALLGVRSIVLTKTLARQLFGKETAMGKTILLNNEDNFLVTGVTDDLPHNSSIEFQYLIPWSYLQSKGWEDLFWGNNSAYTFVLLKEHASLAAANDKMKMFLYPTTRWHLYGNFSDGQESGGRMVLVRMFGLISVFILLIACINFMNLSTARSEKRAKEVGIRKVAGANRISLIFQFIAESIFLALLAGLLAVLLVQLSLPAFNALTEKQLFINYADVRGWAITIGFIIVTGILAGSYPAFFLSGFKPVNALKGLFRHSFSAVNPRRILVVFQFTIATALIMCTLIVRQQINYAAQRDTGYNRNNLIYHTLSEDLKHNYSLIKQELLHSGAAIAVAQSSSPITENWSNSWGFGWEGKDLNDKTMIDRYSSDGGLVETAGLRLLTGRDIDIEHYPTDSTAALINETAMATMHFIKPLGQIIQDNGRDWHVIGVIKDFIITSPYEKLPPMVIEGPKSGFLNIIQIKLNPDISTASSLASVKNIFNTYNPQFPFDYHFADAEYDKKFDEQKQTGILSSLFAALTIFISCLGLFGLATYMAQNRIKEIGIRKVVGASVYSITNLLSRDLLKLVLVALFIACFVAAWAMSKWLEGFAYRIQLEWWVFALAGVISILIALLTVSYQSIRAAMANPVKSLRTE
jgi:putative ABC transport system permease protein